MHTFIYIRSVIPVNSESTSCEETLRRRRGRRISSSCWREREGEKREEECFLAQNSCPLCLCLFSLKYTALHIPRTLMYQREGPQSSFFLSFYLFPSFSSPKRSGFLFSLSVLHTPLKRVAKSVKLDQSDGSRSSSFLPSRHGTLSWLTPPPSPPFLPYPSSLLSAFPPFWYFRPFTC